MRKQFLILLLAVLCAVAIPLLANAESSGLCGVNVQWHLDDSGTLTISGSGAMDSFVGKEAPWGKTIKTVIIEDGVTNIGDEAFSGCSSVTSASIADSVTSIGSEAFAYCSGLKTITIPNSVKTIQSSAFTNCTGLTEVSIPNSVTLIDERAFYKCYNLTKATILESVTSIGNNAFAYCSSLTIYCYKDSTAWQYAQDNSISFVLLDAPPEPAPVINTQPADVKVNAGTTAAFKVEADGDYSYQWYCFRTDGVDWEAVTENGNSAALSFTAQTWQNGNQYYCRVTNAQGAYTDSSNATLTVVSKPVFTKQPVSITVKEGETATFKAASDNADSYQWYYRTSLNAKWNIVKENGTNPTYTFVAKAQQDGYQFCCKAMNSCDSTLSDVATLKVSSKPTIITQPVDVTTKEGSTATFKVTAENADTYLWYYRTSSTGTWKAVTENGTSSSYSFTTAAKQDGYQFRCLLTNDVGSVYTAVATLKLNLKPAITVQPSNVTVKAGSVATFSITAVRADTYQWYYRTSSSDVWTAVGTSGTDSTYTLFTESYHDGYQFRCMAKNSVGSVYSSIATLKVNVIPVISKQPVDITVKQGETAIFQVVSSNADTYKWYYRASSSANWTGLSHATTDTYKVTGQPKNNHHQYRCLLKNSTGSVYSTVVTLTVQCKPIITKQPSNLTVNETEKATFTVEASGVTNYQWYYRPSPTGSWTAASNLGTSASYSLTAQYQHNGSQYRCKLTNSIGSVYTDIVTLTVTQKPVITKHPSNVSVNIGQKATFTVKADKATSFQWYYNDPAVGEWKKVETGGTKSSYSFTAKKEHDRFQYRCRVTNSSGFVDSNTAKLTVVYIPVITAQPKDLKLIVGEKATFTVKATNVDSYQWYYRKNADTAWTALKTDATSATLTFTSTAKQNGYQYRCRVKNAYGIAYSAAATLTVVQKPVIDSQPTSINTNVYKIAMFMVLSSNAESYQWYYLKPGETTWKTLGSDGTSYVYSTIATPALNGYKYKCVLKNSAGSVTSAIVTLTVSN